MERLIDYYDKEDGAFAITYGHYSCSNSALTTLRDGADESYKSRGRLVTASLS